MNKRIQEILQLAQTGQSAEALKRCERAVKKKPRDVDFLLLAASLHAQNNDYANIINYCLRAIKITPKNSNALYNLAVAYLFIKDYVNTIKYSLQLIKIDKKHAKAYANLGLAYWHTGEIDQAKENALIARKFDANIATNLNNLGLIYKSLKDTNNAVINFKQAIALEPRLAEAYFNCGITLIESGDNQGNSYLEKALIIKPDYPELNNYNGLQLLEKGQATQAIELFKKAITAKLDYAEAYCNLGNALMTLQDFTAAIAMYRKAIEHNSQYASAFNNLGNALLDHDDYRNNYTEAEQCYLKAIALSPELDDTYKNLAVCYQGEGFHEKALHYFKIYNQRIPDDQIVIAGMASVHERRAEFDEGIALLKPFIDNNDVSAEIILAYAKFARHFKFEDKAIQALLGINDNDILNKLRIEKYYALGKLSDPKGDADSTFKYYKQANDLEDEEHDFEQSQKMFTNIKSYFSKDKIQNLKRSESNSKLPLFIVGMPRSGTSLAEQILASHTDVFGAGELENMHALVQKIGTDLTPKNNYPLCLDNMSNDFAGQLANAHINDLQVMAPDAKYIVDKMPHNFMALGVINLLFPKATVIHCKRSSIDVCLSIYFQHFNKHHSYSYSLEMLGKYYNLYADLMDHWKNVLDINLIELEYENVIASPEEEMRNLLSECGIEWDPACLKFHENKRTVMTPSYDQVRRPIYKSSVAKWKKYEHHLQVLIDNLGDRAY
ncbi:MAG: sulfotransferase [Methylococcales bacterium]